MNVNSLRRLKLPHIRAVEAGSEPLAEVHDMLLQEVLALRSTVRDLRAERKNEKAAHYYARMAVRTYENWAPAALKATYGSRGTWAEHNPEFERTDEDV